MTAILKIKKTVGILTTFVILVIAQATWAPAYAIDGSDSDFIKYLTDGDHQKVTWSDYNNDHNGHEVFKNLVIKYKSDEIKIEETDLHNFSYAAKTKDPNADHMTFKNVCFGADTANSSKIGVIDVSKFKSDSPNFESEAKLTDVEFKLNFASSPGYSKLSSEERAKLDKTVLLNEVTSKYTMDKTDASLDFTVKKNSKEVLQGSINLVGLGDIYQMAKSNPSLLKELDPDTLGLLFLSKVSLKSLDVSIPIQWVYGKIPEDLPFNDKYFDETLDYCESGLEGAADKLDDICLPYVYAISGQAELLKVHLHTDNPVKMLELLPLLMTSSTQQRAKMLRKMHFSLSN